MTKFTILAGTALLANAGLAVAQPGGARLDRDADITRQQAAAHAEQRFAAMDADNDGRLTREEARQARSERWSERRQHRDERLAQLTPEQRAAIEQRRAQRQEHRADRGERRGGGHGMRGSRMFGEQGFVTREQMLEHAMARFDRLDLNRDGTLTAAERRQARAQLRERFQHRRGQAD